MASVMQEFKCPCCGGAISFDSTLQKMKCPYCDTEFETESLRDYAEETGQDTQDDMQWETPHAAEGETEPGMSVFVCNSCGGEIIGDENTAATACPFCGNPVVISGRLSGALRPDFVIPFQLDKAAAKAGFEKHLTGKTLLPKIFKDQNHIDEIRGIYVPFCIFDADASAKMRYRATRVRHWSDSRFDYTETSFYSLIRQGTLSFEHIPVDGSVKMADDLMESLEPFDFSKAVPFHSAFLAGYFADKYDVSAEDSVKRADERVRNSTEQAFAATTVGYTTATPEYRGIQLKNGKATYALYPVWLLNTTYRGEKFVFAMNGQTGKFVGNLPLDRGAFWKWFGLLTAAVGGGLFAILSLLGV